MTDRGRSSLIGYGLLAVVAMIYATGLDFSPVYLLNDEVFGAIQTLSLATTARSVAGDLLPVYFRGLEFPPGRDPLSIYFTALFLKAMPVSELALRLPTALIGITTIVLAGALGKRLSGSGSLGLLAAVLLAMTPAHFIHSRLALPVLWSVPWLLGWGIGLASYAETRRLRALFFGAFCLGVAGFGYLGTAMIVPLYLIGTFAFLHFSVKPRDARSYVAVAAGFGVPMSLLVYWHIIHPERWSELATYYLTEATVFREGPPLLTSSGLPNFAGVQERASAYWNYFDPSLLFLAGDDSPRYSTGRAGVFLLSAAVFLPVGIYRAAHTRGIVRLLVFCFFVTPVAAALGGQVQIQRVLPMVAYGALLSAMGAAWFISHSSSRVRRSGTLLLAGAAVQFLLFVGDYFGNYRLRSGASRGGNLRGAFEEVIAASKERARPALYLSDKIPNAEAYWRFYAVAFDARTLPTRVLGTSHASVLDSPNGALFVTDADELSGRTSDTYGSWKLRKRIYELDGPTFYSVYEKVP